MHWLLAYKQKVWPPRQFKVSYLIYSIMFFRITTLTFFLLLSVLAASGIDFDPPQPSSGTGRCIANERDALLKFKESLIDPSGWLSSWSGENCCNWTGISCSEKTGNVVELNLKSFDLCELVNPGDPTSVNDTCLFGKLNPSLVNLTYLSFLDLSNNNFQGNSIPDFVTSLKNLKYLDLSYASFSGKIPPHFGNLSNLVHLDFTKNKYPLNLWFSDISWLSNLNSLEYLGLGGVNLSQVSENWLQPVNLLPSLLELHLSDCQLKAIPQSLPLINFTSLAVLDLSYNSFNSPLPGWIFNISTLESLVLTSSKFSGKFPEIPPQRLSLCNLESIDLSYNALSGQINELIDTLSACPDNSQEMAISLISIQLRDNSFSNGIPESIGNLSSLFELDLSFNVMNGTIPETIGQLNRLQSLQLYGNSWRGIITESCFWNLTSLNAFSLSSTSDSLVFNVGPDWIPPFNLTEMEIDNVQIGPKFPSWVRTQSRLQKLSLSNAELSGTIPDWVWTLSPLLWWLDLSGNMLQGTLPDSVRFDYMTGSVDLGHNRLEGSIPLWSNVTSLSLRHNLLSGPIPSDIGEIMGSLGNLDLSNNFLNGSIPPSLSKIPYLGFLDLSSNNLSGKIPQDFQDLQNLIVLDLSKNNLVGEIHQTPICLLSSLLWLNLSQNNLTGILTSILRNCSGLYSIDLRYNRLTGTIPEFNSDRLFSYSYIGLRANMLGGEISDKICSYPDLHILDLAYNNLSGSIPKCLGNKLVWRNLPDHYYVSVRTSDHIEFSQSVELVVKGRRNEYTKIIPLVNMLDLSHNILSGKIPEELTSLSGLGTLSLSWNNLSGKIPQSIGKMRWLESLDLSHNHLSGPIPISMTSLTSLGYLNLSYNNLSGLIPTTNQFLTFNDPSIYEGNSELCGPPLATNCTKTDPIGVGSKVGNEDGDEDDIVWFYVSIGLGFIVGFWVVCGTLVINKSWRIAYFKFADQTIERIALIVSLNEARIRRK